MTAPTDNTSELDFILDCLVYGSGGDFSYLYEKPADYFAKVEKNKIRDFKAAIQAYISKRVEEAYKKGFIDAGIYS